ncbi:hybrid sensor histidine kinase/response regulator [Thiorhodococcus minor]|uniref:histidine kinase n=1 Tax=Thiorhodococcus minor TaxID=57489 RepID=A0A6M0K018_9GAMM|nr:response regulator [Thiorhodococcus minor]NEV62681.1 response regulator [Thiorhodococcus minor]
MPNDRAVVLIVDDQPLNLQQLAEVLDPDYRVKVATNGQQALELAGRVPYPEVILLDVMMPEMDGYAVCKALKAAPLTADTPVIFITAKTDAASESAALEAGAVDFIHKPINPEVVRARVRVQHELAQYRHHLEELVHARTQELAQASDAAESANRAKTAFLHNASHEMRTPLHHIMGMTHVLHTALPEASDQTRLETISQAAQILLRLVTNLLEYTRLEAGELVLQNQTFDVRTLLAEVVMERQESAAEKGLRLLISVDSSIPSTLIGDSGQLHQVLLHLLDNALKFSDQGVVQTRAYTGERSGQRLKLHFEVNDQGSGIEPAIAQRLFQPFEPGDESITRQRPGLGLGLALCQRLVDLMSGEINVESRSARGTSVAFWVPVKIAAEPPEERREEPSEES